MNIQGSRPNKPILSGHVQIRSLRFLNTRQCTQNEFNLALSLSLFTPSVIVKNSHLPVSFLHNLLSDETLFKKALLCLLEGETPDIEPLEPLNQAGIILPAELEKEIVMPPSIRTVVSRITSDPGYILVFTNSDSSAVSEIKIKGQPVNLQPGVMTVILKNDFFV